MTEAVLAAHQSVMLEEVVSSLNLKKGSVVVDGTIGLGGHSREILKKIIPGGRLIGIDADIEALKEARQNLLDFNGSFSLVHGNFRNLDTILEKEGIRNVDAIILDLGVSSYQIEDGSRGFSIKHESRLDMRMDKSLQLSAYDIVNKFSEQELSDIIKEYGEERFHKRIARYIKQSRSKKKIETTRELAEIVHKAIGYGHGKERIDTATRTFQALRIAVNDELSSLEEGLKKALVLLKSGGKIAIISFHSLEDRIVKNIFRENARLGALKIITKKPLYPASAEVIRNPRSRSAKLRIAERI